MVEDNAKELNIPNQLKTLKILFPKVYLLDPDRSTMLKFKGNDTIIVERVFFAMPLIAALVFVVLLLNGCVSFSLWILWRLWSTWSALEHKIYY